MTKRSGRKVILHCLDFGLHQSFRFLDPKTRDFIDCAGSSRKEAGQIAAANGLRIEWSEREDA